MSILDDVETMPLEILSPAARHANLVFKQTGGVLEADDFKAILFMTALTVQIERRAKARRGEQDYD